MSTTEIWWKTETEWKQFRWDQLQPKIDSIEYSSGNCQCYQYSLNEKKVKRSKFICNVEAPFLLK